MFGDVPYPPVCFGGIISGPGPPEPELGDTLGLPDFSVIQDPGNLKALGFLGGPCFHVIKKSRPFEWVLSISFVNHLIFRDFERNVLGNRMVKCLSCIIYNI